MPDICGSVVKVLNTRSMEAMTSRILPNRSHRAALSPDITRQARHQRLIPSPPSGFKGSKEKPCHQQRGRRVVTGPDLPKFGGPAKATPSLCVRSQPLEKAPHSGASLPRGEFAARSMLRQLPR
jgi:hypothetical protein